MFAMHARYRRPRMLGGSGGARWALAPASSSPRRRVMRLLPNAWVESMNGHSPPWCREPRNPMRARGLLCLFISTMIPLSSAFSGLMASPAAVAGRRIACSSHRLGLAGPLSLSVPRHRQARYALVRLFASSADGEKKKLVFLGTPGVAAIALEHLITASRAPGAQFEVSAVVSNPPSASGRKKTLEPSPVHALAEKEGLPVLTPTGIMKKYEDSAEFLEKMRDISPDVCVTAAYGQFLPKSFLSIPKLGTLNIHPSLLPKYRGAAPVPRALEDGVPVTGVSVLFTQFEMDAGPVVGVTERVLDGNEKADVLLPELFETGSKLLLDVLPGVFEGKHKQDGAGCTIQDENEVSVADKMSKDEGQLWFTENAVYMHNKVRAFAGWPGTTAEFVLDPYGEKRENIKVKIITTRVLRKDGGACLGVHEIKANEKGDALVITCDDGSQLEVLELQPPGKKIMAARDFWNGAKKRGLERKRVGWSTGKVPGQA